MKTLILVSAIALSSASLAKAAPAQVLVIRHGEKIDDYNPHLSEKGKLRAQALVKVFLDDPRFNLYGPPVAIYAAEPKWSDSSRRPEETVQPLAEKLHLKINTDYRKKKVNLIADEIVFSPEYNNKTVIVCWAHQTIRELAVQLGAKEVPESWPQHHYDRVWRIKFDNGKAGKVEDLPEHALPGDSN